MHNIFEIIQIYKHKISINDETDTHIYTYNF